MDESTEGVTLRSGSVLAVVEEYRSLGSVSAPLLALVRDLDPRHPEEHCPISLYHTVTDWIEENLGVWSLRAAGRAIGKGAFEHMRRNETLPGDPAPIDVMRELTRVANAHYNDPRGRGWELLRHEPGRITMRRTQTFNCMLQEGLLISLLEQTGVSLPRVEHLKCTRKGHAFCEYDVVWMVTP